MRERTHGVRRSSQRGSLGGRVRRRHHLQDPSRLSRLLGILLAASSGARHIRVLVSHRIEGLIHPRRALAGQIILTARSGGRARGCRTTERHEIVTVDRRHRQQSQERVGLAGVRDSPVLCLTISNPTVRVIRCQSAYRRRARTGTPRRSSCPRTTSREAPAAPRSLLRWSRI